MPRAFVIPHSFHVWPAQMGAYAKGWTPAFVLQLQGTVPSAAQLLAEVTGPGDQAWLALAFDVDESSDETFIKEWTLTAADAEVRDVGGGYRVKMRLVSELEGVDYELLDASFTVEPEADGFVARMDHLLTRGALWLDLGDEDAPRLNAAVWLANGAETHEIGAYLFFNGKKLMEADDVSAGRELLLSTGAAGEHGVRELRFAFDKAKAWRNCEYGDMEGWHDLSLHPGDYEIKVTRAKKLDRSLKFSVGADGRLQKSGAVEPDAWRRWEMSVPVTVLGKADGNWDAAAQPSAAFPVTCDAGLDDLYAPRKIPEVVEKAYDDETQAEIDKVVGDATNYHSWFWDDMKNGSDGSSFLGQCELVETYLSGWRPRYDALAAKLPADARHGFAGGEHTLDEIRALLEEMNDNAKGWLRKARQSADDVRAPYLALLRNDKLAIFNDHPAPDYRYYTSHRQVIETPDELAAAERWYFEGVENQGYINERWTVRGWRFDAEGNIVDRHDESGFGTNAPGSAFP